MEFIDITNAAFYLKIIQSAMALVSGKINDINYEFFLMLNINPNDIDDIKLMMKELNNFLLSSDDVVTKMTQVG